MASQPELKHSPEELALEAMAGLVDQIQVSPELTVPPPSLATHMVMSLIQSPLLEVTEDTNFTVKDILEALFCICKGREALHLLQTVYRAKAEDGNVEKAWKAWDDAVYAFAEHLRPGASYEEILRCLVMYLAASAQPLSMLPKNEDDSSDDDEEIKKK